MPSSQIFWRSLWQFYAWNIIQSYVGNVSEGPAAEIGHRKKLVKEYSVTPRERETAYVKSYQSSSCSLPFAGQEFTGLGNSLWLLRLSLTPCFAMGTHQRDKEQDV